MSESVFQPHSSHIDEARRQLQLLSDKENRVNISANDIATQDDPEAENSERKIRRMAETIRKWKIENVTAHPITKKTDITPRSTLARDTPRSGNFVDFLESIVGAKMLQHKCANLIERCDSKILDGKLTPVQQNQSGR